MTAKAGETGPTARFADLWMLWTQTLMREERLAEAVDAAAQGLHFWPADAALAELAAVVNRRAERAGLFDAEPEVEVGDPTPIVALARAVAGGDTAAIAAALTAALADGADTTAIIKVAQQAKRAGPESSVSTRLAALVDALEAGPADVDATFAPLWRIWTQALMREERYVEAVAVIVEATRRWPHDGDLAEFCDSVERRVRRAGLPEAVLAAFVPPPPPPTPAEVLAAAVRSGTPSDIADVLAAALTAGLGAKAVIAIAQQVKRGAPGGGVPQQLAALAEALVARPGTVDASFAVLWRLWTQALMREDRFAEAVAVIVGATRRWPDDGDLAEFCDSVERRVRRAGLPEAVLAAFVPPPPPPTPAEVLAAAVRAGPLPDIADALAAALDAGLGAKSVIDIAQQVKRAAQGGIVSPRLAAINSALVARASPEPPDSAYEVLWRMLSQTLSREGRLDEALAVAAAAGALWPDSEVAVANVGAMKRKARKHRPRAVSTEPAVQKGSDEIRDDDHDAAA